MWCWGRSGGHLQPLRVGLDPMTHEHFTDLSIHRYDNSRTGHSMLVQTPADTTLRLSVGEIISVRMDYQPGFGSQQRQPQDVECSVVGITPLRARRGTLNRAIVQFELM